MKIIKGLFCALLSFSIFLCACANGGDVIDGTTGESANNSDVMVGADPSGDGQAKKRVAMTFDDGPHNVRTREIVDELDKYGFSATFFVVGNRVDGEAYRGGDTVKYIIEHGHEVGIHGYTHEVYYHNCTDEEYQNEISKTARAIQAQVRDYDINLMRPVGGYITSDRVLSSEYSVIMWNVDSLDYKHAYFPDDERYTDAQKEQMVNTIVENVMSEVKDGSIILMHDIYLSTSHATAIILEKLNAEGYEVVSVSELLGNPAPGVKYNGK